MRKLLIPAIMIGLGAPAAAQMSVTTIGASDAGACYENAINDLARDTGPCDAALDDPVTTRADKAKTRVNRGVIHNRNGAIDAAVADFNAALEINDTLGEAYLNRGNSHYLAARLDAALADYERALDLDVSQPWAAWYNIGLIHDARNNADKAREAYEKALEENPGFTLAQQKLEGRP